MVNITPVLKKEVSKIIPDNAKVGDLFSVSTGDHIRINEVLSDGRFDYTLLDGPIPTKNINDPKLNITTGVDKLKSLQNTQQEKNMANELDVTEIDRIKSEKIQKEKQKEADVAAAIAIAAELRGDIKKIKEELCEGPDCLKQKVENKFGEIDTKIAKLDEKSVEFYACDRCGYDRVPSLSSFCPNCGLRIPSWTTDEGLPVPGWKPYFELHKEEVE